MSRRSRFCILVIASAMALVPDAAFAQTGFLNVSAWFQPTTSFSDVVHPIDSIEPSVVATDYQTRTAVGFEADGGIRVWRTLNVGLGVSRFSKGADGHVSAQVPHPFFFNRPRQVSGDASGLSHDETAIHVQLTWIAPLSPRWQLAIGGGPSWFIVGQDLVTDVTVTETYPYDTAAFSGVTSAHRSGSRAGFNAGFDVAYRLRAHVGVGGGVSFSRASVPLSDTVKVDAGGARVNAGLRFRF